jgi:Chaperone of endosialidase
MANLHGLPDTMAEVMARESDLLSPAILGSSLAVPVPPSLTLPAFTAWGYVREGTPARLKYVNQAAHTVTLAGGDGNYWLALHADTATPVSGWGRQAGTHYLWRAAGTQPADPPGGLVMAGVTVASGGITAVNPSYNYPVGKVAYGGPTGALAFSPQLTWDGSTLRVVGRLEGTQHVTPDATGNDQIAFYTTLSAAGGTNRWALYAGGTAPTFLGGTLAVAGAVTLSSPLTVNAVVGLGVAAVTGYSLTTGPNTQLGANVTVGMVGTAATAHLDVNSTARVRGTLSVDGAASLNAALTVQGHVTLNTTLGVVGAASYFSTLGVQGDVTLANGAKLFLGSGVPFSNITQAINWPHGTGYGLVFRPNDGNDTGAGHPVVFTSSGGATIGSISTTASATSFNTTSDRRAKEAIGPLEGSVATLQALRPVAFRWRATGEAGVGFVADEVQQVVPDAVTGTPDSAMLQGLDMSKLLPYVVGTLHAILQRLDAVERGT